MVSQNKHCLAVARLTALRASISPIWDKRGRGWVGSPRPLPSPTVNKLRGPGIPDPRGQRPFRCPSAARPRAQAKPDPPRPPVRARREAPPQQGRVRINAQRSSRERPTPPARRRPPPREAPRHPAKPGGWRDSPGAAGRRTDPVRERRLLRFPRVRAPPGRARAGAAGRAERVGPSGCARGPGQGGLLRPSFVLPLLQRTGRGKARAASPRTHPSQRAPGSAPGSRQPAGRRAGEQRPRRRRP